MGNFLSVSIFSIFLFILLTVVHCKTQYERNLMKRAENYVDSKTSHITFKNNSWVFHFTKSNGHQNGKDRVGPWYVYANPHRPHIFPVLALARYLFTYPELLVKNTSLFQGKYQYNRYSGMFLLLTKNNLEHLKNLGVEEGDLDTHSCRKGVATVIAEDCTVYPPIVSICLRSSWFMGGVKYKYLKPKYAGDKYVGRYTSGLDQIENRFLFHRHTLISIQSRTK